MAALLAFLTLAVTPADAVEARKYPGCNTKRCAKRVQARAHGKTVRRWKRTAKPYAAWLRRLRACESGGRYWIVSTAGYMGAYQFDLRTWQSVGGRGLPHQATRAEQDFRAVRLRWARGTAPWPVCG